MKRICNVCNRNKVGCIAYWMGLRHCEECEIKAIREYTRMLRKQTARLIEERRRLENDKIKK